VCVLAGRGTRVTSFMVERYTVARRIWGMRTLLAHEGFPATSSRAAVPAQTWTEWFEWAYGMPLAEYAAIAKEGDHAGLVAKMGGPLPLFDYKWGDRWLVMIGVAGDTVETVAALLRARWPEITEVRAHE
jgi:hypothetical protein